MTGPGQGSPRLPGAENIGSLSMLFEILKKPIPNLRLVSTAFSELAACPKSPLVRRSSPPSNRARLFIIISHLPLSVKSLFVSGAFQFLGQIMGYLSILAKAVIMGGNT